MKRWLRNLVLRFLGLAELEARLQDLERHFVTKRDQAGAPIETLADVPPSKRGELRNPKRAGMSPQQYVRWLEATDGGTRAPRTERLPSLS